MLLQTSIHTDASIFEELQQEWLDLLNRSITNFVFQTPQFLSAWWKTLGEGELQIITLRDEEGTLVGLAPLYLHKNSENKNELCFVGCVNVSDYLDMLIDQKYQLEGYAKLEEVLTAELNDWQAMYLCSLPEDSPTREWLKKIFVSAKEIQQDVSPQIVLPQSWELYLARIDRKQRHEVKRKMRRVEEVDHQYEVITEEADAKAALPEFIELHKKSSAEKRDFWDESHLQFFAEFIPAAAKAGWLKLYFLKIENVRTAAMLVFDYNDQYLLYNSGFDQAAFKHLSTGNVLTAYTIQKAIEEKKTVYDFLRGNEEYKFRFGAVAKPVYDIVIKK